MHLFDLYENHRQAQDDINQPKNRKGNQRIAEKRIRGNHMAEQYIIDKSKGYKGQQPDIDASRNNGQPFFGNFQPIL